MEHKFTMSLSLNVLNHLGINLYSNVPAVLSEIVANSWDADAENVTIAISSDEIIIGELTNQIVKYSETMQKVLTETSHAREPFEIICVLGMPVDNNDDPTHREQVNTTLKAWHARIVFYKELIENAYKAYNDYITANRQSQNLIDLMHQLEIETAED